jgi:formamidopyrimidine-DNA glycosylase
VREKELSPDPLDVDAHSFVERFEGRKGGVRATLMNQKVLAGIGNTYWDEILFQAQLRPRTLLKVTIEWEANPWEANPHKLPDYFLLSHRCEGERCQRGKGKTRKSKATGRTAYYCPANRRRGD